MKSFIKDRKFSISVTLLNFVGIIVLIILGEKLGSLEAAFMKLGLSSETWMQEPWTLLTNSFTHANLFHFAVNMLAFWSIIPRGFEKNNQKQLALIYALSIVGSDLLILMASSRLTIGASGAIFGMFGFMAVNSKIPSDFRKNIWVVIAINLILTFALVKYISWSAHLGGLITGIIAGFVVNFIDYRKDLQGVKSFLKECGPDFENTYQKNAFKGIVLGDASAYYRNKVSIMKTCLNLYLYNNKWEEFQIIYKELSYFAKKLSLTTKNLDERMETLEYSKNLDFLYRTSQKKDSKIFV